MPATEHAAVWVPYSEAQYCMHCLKAKFTTMNRRVKYNFTICISCNNYEFDILVITRVQGEAKDEVYIII